MKIEVREISVKDDPVLYGSLHAWRVQYGLVNQSQSHITPYFEFGLVPANYLSNIAWLWFRPGDTPIPLGFLREMRALFEEYLSRQRWTVIAHYDLHDLPAQRFGAFFGFREYVRTDQFIYARRS